MKTAFEVKIECKTPGISALWVQGILKKTLVLEKKNKHSLSILVTDNKGIRKINKQFLGHDYATDVISFWFDEKTLPKNEAGFLGELVVSYETAKEFAEDLKISLKEEFARYLVHGTLHLLGYDDKKKKDKVKMHRRQEIILKKVL